MPRTKFSVARHKQRKRLMKKVEGYRGARGKLLRQAKETLNRAERYAFRDRKQRKRQFRKLWITRINAAARMRGMRYSELINGLLKSKVALNRKAISEMAIHDAKGFDKLVAMAKSGLAKKAS